MPARRRLLVLNQYYWPGVEATAHLLTELCEALAADYDVTVVTGRLRGREDAARRRDAERRARHPRPLGRLRPRAARPARRELRAPTSPAPRPARSRSARPDVILCMTDPPMVGALAVAARPPLPRAGDRRQRGRLPRDRRRAEAALEPGRDRAARRDHELRAAPRRPGRRDRRHDGQAARGEGRRAAPDARDPELGRHLDAHAAAARQRLGARRTGSPAASSSCTRATSATRRTSTT